VSDEALPPAINPTSVDESSLTSKELKILLRLGWLRTHEIKSKHSGGYRYYEVKDRNLSEWEISENHAALRDKGLVTSETIWKYVSQKKQTHHLIDLKIEGVSLYFHLKSMTRVGLEIYDLDYLDKLLDRSEISLQQLNAKVLLKYVDHIDLSEKTGYNISQFGRSVLEKEKREVAEDMLDDLNDAIESSPRSGMSNADIDLMYTVVRRLEDEISRPQPRKNVARAELHIIFQVIQVLGVAAGVVSAVLNYLQFLG
jgi:hypothetical protein